MFRKESEQREEREVVPAGGKDSRGKNGSSEEGT
jgi:hypothetical protein